ncbi:cell wall-binding repeat-containing protein [Alkalihalobacillus sp. CinArs1]|uniref:cell wall-binding repeat-containing protein n=1 Tax=Alkalihalobacillus sp. CinArs1 TaxID=2995314 RepID=UPI0022DE3872|nr:cell wall-binding repeat-containing protein [Alkalihalobacillus sp. CinArs1]
MLTHKFGVSLLWGIGLMALVLSFPKMAEAVEIDRISGSDRIETAVEVSKKGWPDGSDTVVLSRANDFPDALAGTPLAYQENAPILLTQSTKLSNATKKEIQRLNPTNIIILGGSGAVSHDVEAYIEDEMNLKVERISGSDRFETAALIADRMEASGKAAVVSGENFPDALSIAPYAAYRGYPILLTLEDSIPAVTENRIESNERNYVIGGTGVIPNDVEEDIPNSMRIAGSDRYETSRAVADAFPQGSADEVYLATGMDFADALAGSVLAAKTDDSLLLIEKNYVPNPAKLYIADKGLTKFTVLGGYGAIDEYVDTEVSLPIQLLLVNKQRDLPSTYVPAELEEPNVPFPFDYEHNKRKMNTIAVAHLEALFDGAERAGLDLYAQSGYRSYERQKRIYERNVEEHGEEYANRVSAKPGHSEHQTGLAMDVTSPDVDYRLVEEFAYTDEGKWVDAHAHEYGFIIRYPAGEEHVTGYKYEPWHLRYVGKNIATYMKNNDRVLEEYLR